MSGSFNDRGELEIGDGRIILATGKKRSGKSIMAKYLFETYPGDKVVIDVAGDDGPMGEGVTELVGTAGDLPVRWPEHLRDDDKPMTLRYVPDAGSPTYLEDMDAVVGLVLHHGREQHHRGKLGAAVMVHEVGVLMPANRTPAHCRRLLNANRHYHTTAILCGPRPQTIDPLVLAQADLVYVFDTPNPADRKRIAETIGWNPADMDEDVAALGRHEYLRFDANELAPPPDLPLTEPDPRLVHFPPLPEDVVKAVR